jgi:hypothetical protein
VIVLDIGCVWDGTAFGASDVEILRDMVARNLPEGTEGRFICFTDEPDDLGPWITKLPLLADRGETIMFPLGCCIVRGLDSLLKSGNVECAFYNGEFPKTAQVVVFADDNPGKIPGWPQQVYKIGGGTAAEMSFIPAVPLENLSANIRHALGLNCRWFEPVEPHDGILVICGGAPSLAEDLPVISLLSREATVWAINGVADYLFREGITPDGHVMLDALPECLRFVSPHIRMTRYYASQVNPSVLDAAGSSLVCWHAGGEGMKAIKDVNFRNIVGGGSTAASRAMVLGHGLGYRKFHLFGLDSSYENRVHAYEQRGYEKTVDAAYEGRTFRTSPQLLGQADDFKIMLPDFINAGCEVVVHGDGLLKAIASQMTA